MSKWIKVSELEAKEIFEMYENSQEDIHVNDRGIAFIGGKIISKSLDGNPDFNAIRKWCKNEMYFPNVWVINDHGNKSLYSYNGSYRGGIV